MRSPIMHNWRVSAAEIDAYLAELDEPKRSTLERLRESILRAAPGAEQCISYGMPAFRVDGKVIAGFAAFKNHLAYLPHSGSVFGQLDAELADFTKTTGSLHFPVDVPLDDVLVARLVDAKQRQTSV
jgi:uncharacterized protein YdhG (YjbR/CyaY superfamily)